MRRAEFSGVLLAMLSATSVFGQTESPKEYAKIADKAIASPSFTADGKTLVFWSDNKAIVVWDVASRTIRDRFQIVPVPYPTQNMLLSPNGKSVYFDRGEKVRRFDFETKRSIDLFLCDDTADFLRFSKDGSLLAAGAGSQIQIWNVKAGRSIRTIQAEGYVREVRFFPDSKFVASSIGVHKKKGADGIWIWDLDNKKPPRQLRFDKYNGGRLAISSDGATVVLVADEFNKPELLVWDVPTGKLRARWPIGTAVEAMEFSSNGRILFCSGGSENAPSGHVLCLDALTGKAIADFVALPDKIGYMSLSPDERLLALACHKPSDEMKVFDISAIINSRK